MTALAKSIATVIWTAIILAIILISNISGILCGVVYVVGLILIWSFDSNYFEDDFDFGDDYGGWH